MTGSVAWVTGANGFLGGHTVRGLTEAGWRVVAFARAVPEPEEKGQGGGAARWLCGPLDAGLLETASREEPPPTLVIHALGTGSVGAAAALPVEAFDATVRSTVLLLDHLRRTAPAARLLYPSSAAVYGESPDALVEDAPPRPVSAYGWHKLMAETLLDEARALHGLDCTAIRFFSVYGPGLRKQVLWDWSRRLLAGEAPLAVSGTGEEVRDFLYVDDAVALLSRLAAAAPGANPAVVNGGTGRGTGLGRLAHLLAEALGQRAEVSFDGRTRPGDPFCYRADTRLLSRLGFSPAVPVEDGLRRYARWVRDAL